MIGAFDAGRHKQGVQAKDASNLAQDEDKIAQGTQLHHFDALHHQHQRCAAGRHLLPRRGLGRSCPQSTGGVWLGGRAHRRAKGIARLLSIPAR